jgi:transglutaminase-like putative cysteine protease
VRLSINHRTSYEFSMPVARGLQRLRLTPKSTQGQSIGDWQMAYEGITLEAEYDDQHHNRTQLASVEPGVREVTITCTGIVDTSDQAGIIGSHTGHMPLSAFLEQSRLTRPGARMRALIQRLGGEGAAAAGAGGGSDTGRLDTLHELSSSIRADVAYRTGETLVTTPAEDAMAAAVGVCQDHAHIFLGCARALGIPSRYVSGYLMMNDRIDQDAGHAWAEAYVDGLGWVGFDISNGISPDSRYVRVATGRDYGEAAPITGISFGAHETLLKVHLAVEQQAVEQ